MKISRLGLPVALLIICVFSFTAYQSCIKDGCSKILCNAGVCVSGRCACPTGYEGDNCELLWSSRFSGLWHNTELVQDSSGIHSTAYDLTVRGNEAPGTLLIDHLEGVYDSIVCRITSRYAFQLQTQSTPDSTFRINSGNGTMDSVTGKVSVNYSFIQNGVSKSAAMSWTR